MLINNLIVKKSADTGYIPIKYNICQMLVGATPAATNCVIECIRNGWDTGPHYIDWTTKRTTTGIQGTLGVFEVVALSTLVAYSDLTPSRDM
jgi:hypothetical protein